MKTLKNLVVVVVLMLVVVGCGSTKDCDEIAVIYPQGGTVFYTDTFMFIQFLGPTDKTYYISFVLAPSQNTPVKYGDGTMYDDRLEGYRIGGMSLVTPSSPYGINIWIPWDIPSGTYTLKIIFTDKYDHWYLDPILFFQETDEFKIMQGKG